MAAEILVSRAHAAAKHRDWIDRDEAAFTSCQHRSIRSANLGRVVMFAAVFRNRPANRVELLIQRHRPEVFHGHPPSERDDFFLPVHLAHRFIKNRRDNAAVDIPRWSLIAARKAKNAFDGAVLRVIHKAEAQPKPIVRRAAETMIFFAEDCIDGWIDSRIKDWRLQLQYVPVRTCGKRIYALPELALAVFGL